MAQKELQESGRGNSGSAYRSDPKWGQGFIAAARYFFFFFLEIKFIIQKKKKRLVAQTTQDLVSAANSCANKEMGEEAVIATSRMGF